MFTNNCNKSIIQQTAEILEAKNRFSEDLNYLMEKFQIQDTVFAYNGRNVVEVTNGYFVLNEEYDNLNEAIKNGNGVIRIIDNTKFQTGEIKLKISDCPKDKQIFDLDVRTL